MRRESLFLLAVVVCGCSRPVEWSSSVRWTTASRRVEAPPVDPAETLRTLDRLGADYGICVTAVEPAFPIATRHGEINGRPCSDAEVGGYVDLLTQEFSLYPRELVRRACLNRIVLCTNLTYAAQHRGAVPDFERNTLYLDVALGRHDRLHRRSVIHHEFFHLVDYRDDGLLYDDDLWRTLNAAEFHYGDGGKHALTLPYTAVLTDRYPGFLNHYSTTGLEEDKAELFAQLLIRPGYVESRAKNDLVLSAKVELMKRRLALFCPAADQTFWTAATLVNR